MARKVDDRQARRQRMLAKEQGITMPGAPVPGTSSDIGLRTPKKLNRVAPKAPPAAKGNLKSIRPLLEQRRRRRTALLAGAVAGTALLIVLLSGALSSSIAALGDAADSFTLYLDRGNSDWPVNTGITDPLQIEELAGGFVALNTSDVAIYSAYGSRVRTMQPGYARPTLSVGAARFVLYNRGGTELQVESRTRNLYTKRFDNNLLLCAMSDNGMLAVVTESGRYTAELSVYDRNFEEILTWQMTEGTPISLSFAPDNRRLAVGSIAAQNGQIHSTVTMLDTGPGTAESPVYTATPGSTLLRLDWLADQYLMAVFDSYLAVIDPRTGQETDRYDYGGASLQSVAPARQQTALLLTIRGGNNLIVLDGTDHLTPLTEIPAGQASAVTATSKELYLLTPSAVECYSFSGVQKWVRQTDTGASPLAVLDAAETLLFTGSTAEILGNP